MESHYVQAGLKMTDPFVFGLHDLAFLSGDYLFYLFLHQFCIVN